jgi:hypothetical protein
MGHRRETTDFLRLRMWAWELPGLWISFYMTFIVG